MREATSETYGPRVYFPSYLISRQQAISGAVFILLSLLCIFIIKIPKILSYHLYQLSLLQVAVKGLTTPYRVGCEDLFVCVGARNSCVASYWIDTLVLKN